MTDESFSHHAAVRFRALTHVASAPNPARAQRGGRPTHTHAHATYQWRCQTKGNDRPPAILRRNYKARAPDTPYHAVVQWAWQWVLPLRACKECMSCSSPKRAYVPVLDTSHSILRRADTVLTHLLPEPALHAMHCLRQQHLSLRTAVRIDGAADATWDRPITRTHTQRPAPCVWREAHRAPFESSRPVFTLRHCDSGAADGAADVMRSRLITWIREEIRVPLVCREPINGERARLGAHTTLRATARSEQPGIPSTWIEWQVSIQPKVTLDGRKTRTHHPHERSNVSLVAFATLPPPTALAHEI